MDNGDIFCVKISYKFRAENIRSRGKRGKMEHLTLECDEKKSEGRKYMGLHWEF